MPHPANAVDGDWCAPCSQRRGRTPWRRYTSSRARRLTRKSGEAYRSVFWGGLMCLRSLLTPIFCRWLQPISAALIWSRSKLSTWAHKVKATTTTQSSAGRGNDGSVRGVVATLRSYVIPRRPRCDHPPRPPPVTRPPPEAIQVAVMIAMPSPSSLSSRQAPDRPQYVGQPGVREYEIGVVRIPWPSGEGP